MNLVVSSRRFVLLALIFLSAVAIVSSQINSSSLRGAAGTNPCEIPLPPDGCPAGYDISSVGHSCIPNVPIACNCGTGSGYCSARSCICDLESYCGEILEDGECDPGGFCTDLFNFPLNDGSKCLTDNNCGEFARCNLAGRDQNCSNDCSCVNNTEPEEVTGFCIPIPTSSASIASVSSVICGDGIAEGLEACDDNGESAFCDADCTNAVCGDTYTNTTAGEECDDGNQNDDDSCGNDCKLPVCGDGELEGGETCDNGTGCCGQNDDQFSTPSCQSGPCSCPNNTVPEANLTNRGCTCPSNVPIMKFGQGPLDRSCVECLSDTDCRVPGSDYCDLSTNTCTPCSSSPTQEECSGVDANGDLICCAIGRCTETIDTTCANQCYQIYITDYGNCTTDACVFNVNTLYQNCIAGCNLSNTWSCSQSSSGGGGGFGGPTCDNLPGCAEDLCRGNLFGCDDGDDCTQDVCNSGTGACDHRPWIVPIAGCSQGNNGGGGGSAAGSGGGNGGQSCPIYVCGSSGTCTAVGVSTSCSQTLAQCNAACGSSSGSAASASSASSVSSTLCGNGEIDAGEQCEKLVNICLDGNSCNAETCQCEAPEEKSEGSEASSDASSDTSASTASVASDESSVASSDDSSAQSSTANSLVASSSPASSVQGSVDTSNRSSARSSDRPTSSGFSSTVSEQSSSTSEVAFSFGSSVSSFFSSEAQSSDSLSLCGNGIINPGEECDRGFLNGPPGSNAECACNPSIPRCRSTIPGLQWQGCTWPVCGDGIVNNDILLNGQFVNFDLIHEECDDGNFINADSCSNSCSLNIPLGSSSSQLSIIIITSSTASTFSDVSTASTASVSSNISTFSNASLFSNNSSQGTENDDDDNENSGGDTGGDDDDACTSDAECTIGICINGDCTPCIDNSECSSNSCNRGQCLPDETLVAAASICGNGTLEQYEECDDSNRRDNDGCSSTCLLEIGICGDGVIQSLLGEQCEQSVHSPTLPYSCIKCRFLSTTCGDGNIDGGEECDDGTQNSTSPDALCRPDCSLSRCGDGVVDSTEMCDDGNRISNDGCDRYCRTIDSNTLIASDTTVQFPGTILPATVLSTFQQQQQQFQFPQYPNYQQLPYQLPFAQLQPLIAPQGVAGETGPAAVAVVASGMAAGLGWMRRRRK